MSRHATAAAWAILQAAPDGAPEGLHWRLLFGGSAGTVIALVLSSVLYRAFCRRGSPSLEWGSFFIGLTGGVGWCVAIWGAFEIVARAPNGPPADTSAFLLLLAATVGIGAILVGAFVLSRASVPPPQARGPLYLPPRRDPPAEAIGVAVAVDLVAAVLAVLGAAGVIHLNVAETVAWAHVGVGLGVIAAVVLYAIVWTLIAIANPP